MTLATLERSQPKVEAEEIFDALYESAKLIDKTMRTLTNVSDYTIFLLIKAYGDVNTLYDCLNNYGFFE